MGGFIFFVILFLFVMFMLLMRHSKSTEFKYPYYEVRPVSDREMVFYWRLVEALPDCLIFPQVGLSRFLRVKSSHHNRTHFLHISRMSVDFLVCLKSAAIVAAIELDDSTHDNDNARFRDKKKDDALAGAGVRLLRYRTVPTVDQIRRDFLE